MPSGKKSLYKNLIVSLFIDIHIDKDQLQRISFVTYLVIVTIATIDL